MFPPTFAEFALASDERRVAIFNTKINDLQALLNEWLNLDSSNLEAVAEFSQRFGVEKDALDSMRETLAQKAALSFMPNFDNVTSHLQGVLRDTGADGTVDPSQLDLPLSSTSSSSDEVQQALILPASVAPVAAPKADILPSCNVCTEKGVKCTGPSGRACYQCADNKSGCSRSVRGRKRGQCRLASTESSSSNININSNNKRMKSRHSDDDEDEEEIEVVARRMRRRSRFAPVSRRPCDLREKLRALAEELIDEVVDAILEG